MQITNKKTISVSKLIINVLRCLGTSTIFGYPGSSVLPLYSELSKQSEIKHYLFRHEQSAVHAAEGYARVSGKCGVVLVTAGPGASNTITGIANAYLDGFPLIVISGQVSSKLKGQDAFQEISFSEMVKSCTKASFKIEKAEEAELVILQAYLLAMAGKKGPVVIEIPKDIFDYSVEYKNLSLPDEENFNNTVIDTTNVLELLKTSKNPVIVSGGGVIHSKAENELYELSTMLNIPVVSTMMGIGAFPQNNSLYAGMIGSYGDDFANNLLKKSDLLIVLGARFNDRVSDAFDMEEINRKNIIQVDINPKELLRNIRADFVFNCDIKEFVYSLLKSLKNESNNFEFNFENVKKQVNDFSDDKLTMKNIAKFLYEYTKDKSCIIATDVGQHQVALIGNYKFTEKTKFLTSGGLGTMGFGFPAAIGASIAKNFAPVILFTGDGSFQMSIPELAVCKEYNIPIKIFIMNNGYLGMVRQLQEEHFDKDYYATEISNPDFVTLAKSYGIDAIRVETLDDVNSAFNKAFAKNEPYVVDFVTESFENV